MTDVKISVQLLNDAQDDRFDTALIISGDSDLAPPINSIRQRYDNKRVVVAFPPNRFSSQLRSSATASLFIGRKKLKDNQLPDPVETSSGYELNRPIEWQ